MALVIVTREAYALVHTLRSWSEESAVAPPTEVGQIATFYGSGLRRLEPGLHPSVGPLPTRSVAFRGVARVRALVRPRLRRKNPCERYELALLDHLVNGWRIQESLRFKVQGSEDRENLGTEPCALF